MDLEVLRDHVVLGMNHNCCPMANNKQFSITISPKGCIPLLNLESLWDQISAAMLRNTRSRFFIYLQETRSNSKQTWLDPLNRDYGGLLGQLTYLVTGIWHRNHSKDWGEAHLHYELRHTSTHTYKCAPIWWFACQSSSDNTGCEYMVAMNKTIQWRHRNDGCCSFFCWELLLRQRRNGEENSTEWWCLVPEHTHKSHLHIGSWIRSL